MLSDVNNNIINNIATLYGSNSYSYPTKFNLMSNYSIEVNNLIEN